MFAHIVSFSRVVVLRRIVVLRNIAVLRRIIILNVWLAIQCVQQVYGDGQKASSFARP